MKEETILTSRIYSPLADTINQYIDAKMSEDSELSFEAAKMECSETLDLIMWSIKDDCRR